MFKNPINWRGVGAALALVAALGLADTVVEAGTDTDPEWVTAAISAGKMQCNKSGTKFTMKLAAGGRISGVWAGSYSGWWNVDPNNAAQWCRTIGNGSEECQPVTLNDDGSITFGPSTCRPKK